MTLPRNKGVIVLLLVGIFLVGSTSHATASDPKSLLVEDAISISNIRTFFENAYITTTVDQDGDIRIVQDGIITFINVDSERKVINTFCLWNLSTSASTEQKHALANELNDEMLMVRFAITDNDKLLCDYQQKYEGGITPYMIVNNYRTFLKVVKESVMENDPENIIATN